MRPEHARDLSEVMSDESIGQALAVIRRDIARQSQASFAAACELTRDQLAFIETGRTPINADLCWRICKANDCHPSWVMNGGGPDPTPQKFSDLPVDDVVLLEKILSRRPKISFRLFWGIAWPLILRKDELTKKVKTLTNDAVKPALPELIKRLNQATQARGRKSELAAWLGVHRQMVTDWLSEKQEPGGEITLRLLYWVEQQERQK